MYSQSTRNAVRGNTRRYSTASGQRRGAPNQEQVRLVQLAVCTILFFAVFLWNGVFPQKMVQVRDDILTLISADFDFEAALFGLGESLADSGTVLADLGEFCVEVFGAGPREEQVEEVTFTPPQPAGVLTAELLFLSQEPTLAARTDHYANLSRLGLTFPAPSAHESLSVDASAQEEAASTEDTVQPEEAPAIPAAGTVVVVSDYDGPELPNNYTMDQLSLGDLETMTPVLGRLTSEYGYRDHPIDGVYHFHTGVDIAAKMGDPIAAFADGTVEYIGEDDSYGLYLQLDHGNGVKSFYAHCSKIEVTKGQTVSIGDTVAKVGSTGSSTGPHLHLELKYNKMHLNPAYYVTFSD